MDIDLSARYNDGLVPAPRLDEEPAPLQSPAWQPTPVQVAAARKQLAWSIVIVAILIILALASSWRL